jgi:hypothetical protein
MNVFETYFQLGWDHILDPAGFDHMLFLVTLCAMYSWRRGLQLIILATAFTVGHSLTLALSALGWVRVPADLIETIIPLTILLTALYNLFRAQRGAESAVGWHYLLALVFGLVHGLGFSNFFRALHPESDGIVYELFSFNVGIEAGQILIVLLFVALYFVLDKVFFIQRRDWTIFWSGLGAGMSVLMTIGWI